MGGREPRRLSRQVLAEICEPRMEEILTLLDQELVRSGLKNMIGAGVVLTGGTALIQAVRSSANKSSTCLRASGIPQCGRAQRYGEQSQVRHGHGPARFGAEKEGMEQKFRIRSDGNVFNSILSRMKSGFPNFLTSGRSARCSL